MISLVLLFSIPAVGASGVNEGPSILRGLRGTEATVSKHGEVLKQKNEEASKHFDALKDVIKIDLNDPPETRWNEAIKKVHEENPDAIPAYLKDFGNLMKTALSSYGGAGALNQLLVPSFNKHLADIMKEEDGIIKLLKELIIEIPESFTLSKLVYALQHFESCTSILGWSSDGDVFLGRNFDYILPNTAPSVTREVALMRGEKLVLRGTVQFPFVAIFLDGMNSLPGVEAVDPYSFSINSRMTKNFSSKILSPGKMVAELSKGERIPAPLMTRFLFNECPDYECAKKILKTKPILTEAYFILAGKKKGISFTREGHKTVSERPLTLLVDDEAADWIVQTNHDENTSPSNPNDKRVERAKDLLKQFHKPVDLQTELMPVLENDGIKKCLNRNSFRSNNSCTIHSVVMCPGTGFHKLKVQR